MIACTAASQIYPPPPLGEQQHTQALQRVILSAAQPTQWAPSMLYTAAGHNGQGQFLLHWLLARVS